MPTIRTQKAIILPAGILIAFCQELAAIACKLFLKMRGGYAVRADLPKLSHKTRYVIAGNHQSMIDPFAIFALLPFRQRMRVLPLKFMTFPAVYHRWYLKPFCYALGCYPAHIRERNHHTYGVEGTIKLLNYGYNICIFPEGTRTLQKDSKPKDGIVRILEQHPEAQLLLAHLKWGYNEKGKKFLRMIVKPAPETLDKTDPKAIMDAIYAL
jgi:1-acyl-sn-glycerol-3-phosphate acyltransferase